MRVRSFWWVPVALAAAAPACGADDASGGASDLAGEGPTASGDRASNGGGFAANGGGATGGTGGATGGPQVLPPEMEVRVDFELPHAGKRFVYVANPDSDTVAVIDSTNLNIQTVEPGDQPTFLQTLAGRDAAVVLNIGTEDAAIIRTDESGSRLSKVGILRGSNAIAVAPDGKHAVVYFDPDFSSTGRTSGNFQSVTVIALDGDAGDRAIDMTVGFKPSAVSFDDASSQAYVVTEDGVSILDFRSIEEDGSGIAKTVALGSVGIDQALDVSVTPDGRFALAREQSSSVLRLVELSTGDIRLLDLATVSADKIGLFDLADAGADAGTAGSDAGTDGASPNGPPMDAGTDAPADAPAPLADAATGPGGDAGSSPDAASAPLGNVVVTDVDLSPSGDFAMAALREQSSALRIPIPGAFDDTSTIEGYTIPGEVVGSIEMSPDGRFALLFTTAIDTNERLTILDLESDEDPKTVQLEKSIRAIAIAPDGSTALVIHKKLAGSPDEPGLPLDAAIDRSYGYSLVQLETGFDLLETTEAEIGPFAIVPDGSYLFVLFSGGVQREVQRVQLRSFQVDRIRLGSPPISVGPVPGTGKVFVGQDHPDGRITFIDWESGDVESVTGFELNSRIRE